MDREELEEEFPANSKSNRVVMSTPRSTRRDQGEDINPPKKKIKKSIKGRAVRQKRSFTQNIAKTFFGEDTKGVGMYILYDVLIPAAKNTIQEMISSGIEMLLFGETRSHSRSKEKGRSIVSYGSFYKRGGRDEEPRARSSRLHDRFDLDEIVFRRGDEAAEVLDGLIDLLEEYEQVTVADYFELAGVEGGTWAHQKWGWENLNKAYCTHTRGGWAIVLPKPIELD